MRRSLLLLALVGLLLAACSRSQGSPPGAVASPTSAPPPATPLAAALPVSPVALPPAGTDNLAWWNDTVWYEVFVRSFYDSDGDGIGDLQGLTQKLDYLNDGDPATTTDLGVTGLWLMPVAESPSYHGYDVVDYYAIESDYGTEEDFKTFLAEAHKRGMRVIVDLVLNHTSSQHPWFQAARAGDPQREGWYRFVTGERPTQFAPWGGGNIWYPAGDSRSYYAIFWSEMPDLNYENPDVTAEAQAISRFWLEEMGVDGFRLDAVRHLIESGRAVENTPETHAWLKGYHSFIRATAPDAFALGEVWSTTDKVVPYIGDELDAAFEFDTAKAILSAAGGESAGPIRIAHAVDSKVYPAHQYATFITNHDQDRAFSQLQENMQQMRVAAALLLTGPGIPFVYYGEEVAMTGRKPDEDIRKPMPWTGDAKGGFTEGVPWRALSAGYKENNVAAMTDDPDSLLSLYRRLIALRNNHEALRVGDHLLLDSSLRTVYPFLRQSDDESLLVLVNLSSEAASGYTLSLEAGARVADGPPAMLLGQGEPTLPSLNEAGGFSGYAPLPTLAPYSTTIIQLRP